MYPNTWAWVECWKTMEKDYQSDSKKFWLTVQRLSNWKYTNTGRNSQVGLT